jgi:hypothetical protein
METRMFSFTAFLFAVAVSSFQLTSVHSQTSDQIKAKIDTIQKQIEEIRGLKFKKPVKVQNQSLADFGKYLDHALERQMPEKLAKNYGKIVAKLGLYRGPEIGDVRVLAKMVMQTQAAAYYDPATETFYIVMHNLPEGMLASVYAHELYHGLQDQYFDLEKYVLSQSENHLNDDELLARQATVEGEATYIMTLWSMKTMLGAVPDTAMLEMAINMQAQLDIRTMLNMLKSGVIPGASKSDIHQAVNAIDEIPPFLLETLVGAYLKGMAFVFQIQKHGWEKVQSLYSQPPVSSEQILHPQKWLANEKPYRLQWAAFSEQPIFAGWDLLETNTIGELQWRIIFAAHDLASEGIGAAAGWNGDTFTVLENQITKELLLLLYTCWDSKTDAEEFYTLYQKLLKIKYPDESFYNLQIIENEVLIVEGGGKGQLEVFLSFMKNTERKR